MRSDPTSGLMGDSPVPACRLRPCRCRWNIASRPFRLHPSFPRIRLVDHEYDGSGPHILRQSDVSGNFFALEWDVQDFDWCGRESSVIAVNGVSAFCFAFCFPKNSAQASEPPCSNGTPRNNRPVPRHCSWSPLRSWRACRMAIAQAAAHSSRSRL